MRDPPVSRHVVIARDPAFYQSHPHAAVASNGDIVVVFNRAPRRSHILHPPHDPLYRNVVARSSDGGTTWSAPEVVPDYAAPGTECAGLTALPNGRMLLNQWRFDWFPLGLARRIAADGAGGLHFPTEFASELIQSGELDTGPIMAQAAETLAPWARGHGKTFVCTSDDDGRCFTSSIEVDTRPFHGGYGMRGTARLPTGALLLPLNDIPEYRTIFTVQSCDDGRSWSAPTLVARADGHLFTEPALVALPTGRLLCMFRDDATRILHQCFSDDGGATWSTARPNGIAGYPPHLLALPGGGVLCTYASRVPEFSIRAAMSDDDGQSWPLNDEIRVRGNLANRDLGYPATVSFEGGWLLTVYYCQDASGVTGIEATQWQFARRT